MLIMAILFIVVMVMLLAVIAILSEENSRLKQCIEYKDEYIETLKDKLADAYADLW
jgi:uncharacterized membrane protein